MAYLRVAAVTLALLVAVVGYALAQSKQCPGAGWTKFDNTYCKILHDDVDIHTFKLTERGRDKVCDGGEPCWLAITEYANLFVECPLSSRDIDPNYLTAINMERTSWYCEALVATSAHAIVPSVAFAALAAGLAVVGTNAA
mmetsp:Transcript_23311/g.81250  ORF Transcript_23311/g.81250 Transcript_23311/m.81250 type:complete len:141 (-) Transcript_23311:1191-1613(-)